MRMLWLWTERWCQITMCESKPACQILFHISKQNRFWKEAKISCCQICEPLTDLFNSSSLTKHAAPLPSYLFTLRRPPAFVRKIWRPPSYLAGIGVAAHNVRSPASYLLVPSLFFGIKRDNFFCPDDADDNNHERRQTKVKWAPKKIFPFISQLNSKTTISCRCSSRSERRKNLTMKVEWKTWITSPQLPVRYLANWNIARYFWSSHWLP